MVWLAYMSAWRETRPVPLSPLEWSPCSSMICEEQIDLLIHSERGSVWVCVLTACNLLPPPFFFFLSRLCVRVFCKIRFFFFHTLIIHLFSVMKHCCLFSIHIHTHTQAAVCYQSKAGTVILTGRLLSLYNTFSSGCFHVFTMKQKQETRDDFEETFCMISL